MSTKGSLRTAALASSFLVMAPLAMLARPPARSARPPAATARTAPSRNASATPLRPQLDPKAIDILKRVSARLADGRTLSFVAAEISEAAKHEDTPVRSLKTFEVTLQRPNRLRVTVSHGGSRSDFYCNDTTMMTYAGAAKAVVIAKAPPTIGDCLTAAYKASSISVPFPNLLIADGYSALTRGLKRAGYIGRLDLSDGTTADVVAYSTGEVSVQMWVGTESGLPGKIQLVRADDPNRVRRTFVLSNWRINAPVPVEVFTMLAAPHDVDTSEPRPVGTSGMQAARRDQRLTLHTYSSKYWGSTVPVYGVPYPDYSGYYYGGPVPSTYGGAAYYSSPDGYGFYPPPIYGSFYPPGGFPYSGAPPYGWEPRWGPEGAPVPGVTAPNDTESEIANFNLALTTDWYNNYNADTGMAYNPAAPMNTPGQPTFVPGQVVKRLPVGCAVPYRRGPAFYLCGNTWFSGVFGPDGKLYYRVLSVPGWSY